LTGEVDADDNLPPGLPIRTNGAPVTAGTDAIIGVLGPESAPNGTVDHFANVIISGVLARDGAPARVLAAWREGAFETLDLELPDTFRRWQALETRP